MGRDGTFEPKPIKPQPKCFLYFNRAKTICQKLQKLEDVLLETRLAVVLRNDPYSVSFQSVSFVFSCKIMRALDL